MPSDKTKKLLEGLGKITDSAPKIRKEEVFHSYTNMYYTSIPESIHKLPKRYDKAKRKKDADGDEYIMIDRIYGSIFKGGERLILADGTEYKGKLYKKRRLREGMNGQNFSFNGYLPINKKERILKIKKIEKNSNLLTQSQIFIETPYRNNQLFNDLIRYLKPYTRLCIASNLTSKKEYINTMRIFEWKSIKIELNKKPTIFIIESIYN